MQIGDKRRIGRCSRCGGIEYAVFDAVNRQEYWRQERHDLTLEGMARCIENLARRLRSLRRRVK